MRAQFGLALLGLFCLGNLLYPLGGLAAQTGFSAVALALTGFFLYGMYLFARHAGVTDFLRKSVGKIDRMATGCVALIAALFVLLYLLSEQYIYYWDYGAYWKDSIRLAETMRGDLYGALLSSFLISVNTMSYNAVISAFMVAPLLLGGQTYVAFYLFVCILFFLPACLLFSAAICQYVLCSREDRITLPLWLVMLCVIVACAGLVPVLNGYADAFCLLPMGVLYCIALRRRYRIFSVKDVVITGICLLLAIFGRRYILYFAVGFTAAVLCVNGADLGISRLRGRYRKGEWTAFIFNMLLIGGFCAVLLGSLFLGFTLMSLFGDYATAYQAYSTGSILQNFLQMFRFLGVIPCALALLGVVRLLFGRRFYVLFFLLVSFVISGVLFAGVQAMGQQHLYIIFFPVCALAAAGMEGVVVAAYRTAECLRAFLSRKGHAYTRGGSQADKRGVRAECTAVLSLALVFHFACMSVLSGFPFAAQMTGLAVRPKVRNDIQAYERLTDYLYSFVEGTEAQIYCIGSGEVFNDDILRNVYLPQTSKISENIAYVSHVDLRDGFSPSFLYSDYVVTASPCEYHLGESSQRVVSVLYEAVTGASPLNDNLQRAESFSLDKGIVVTVWLRIAPYDREDLDYLIARFNEYYPDRPDLFEDRILVFG